MGNQTLHYFCWPSDDRRSTDVTVNEMSWSIKILLENGANIDARNKLGRTPLHEAVYLGDLEYMQALLENGASATAKDNCGNEALHLAVATPKVAIVEMLLKSGANVAAKNNYGITILDWTIYATRHDPADLEPSDG